MTIQISFPWSPECANVLFTSSNESTDLFCMFSFQLGFISWYISEGAGELSVKRLYDEERRKKDVPLN